MKKLYKFFIVLGLFLFVPSFYLFAQVGINADNNAPDPSAGLDVNFNNKGFLPPRMTFEQRNAIPNPVEGLMVYCTNCNQDGTGTITIFQGGNWMNISGSCVVPASPPAGSHLPSVTEIIWKWNKAPIATGYKWNNTNNYASAIDVGPDTAKTETGLTCWTTYIRYVWAYNACGNSEAQILTQKTSPILFSPAPAAGVNVAGPVSIIWNWNSVSGATGYKWGLTDDFDAATDMATVTTKTETGLTCGTSYTRFVWTYNGCGYSNPVSLTQATVECLICGTSIAKNHVAGTVAPVAKTTTYGTVTNISGELTKCWITSNLGSDHQATGMNDATEASAGWYWQFNRKQGYKHDGSTRTPNSAWINNISETSNWMAANDPCTIELGADWRIPTITEWTNVDAGGNWVDLNGPWNSALKMHVAGDLDSGNGSLLFRGVTGYYWSSTSVDATNGWLLKFGSAASNVYNNGSKTNGFSARCIRNY
ncbi:MAG: hypothetical protein NTW16_18040 [Bacteroidetes bacterium]|nr:hypothetical protein [Bacteroidota bacterium]